MIQDGKLRGFAMGQAIPVRTDYTAGEVRRFAQRAKDAAPARRLLAIAAVLDGAWREDAAKIGGMDRQTLRDWVILPNTELVPPLCSPRATPKPCSFISMRSQPKSPSVLTLSCCTI